MNLEKISKERYNPDEEYLGLEKEINKIQPLISVCVMAYQHEHYIEHCIDGILAQKTDFPVEIIIGEDESTDGTREICKQYARKYPDKIRLFLRDRNTSQVFDDNGNYIGRLNARWNRMAARGKYLAICEGDDYWTHPLKLQKQVTFLEENEDYILTAGGYEIYYEKDKRRKEVISDIKKPDREYGYTFTLEEAGRTWITKVLTLVYRNEALDSDVLKNYKYTRDVHIVYHLLQKGKGFYFTDVFGVYRVHDGGMFSMKNDVQKSLLKYKINKEIFEVNGDEHSRKMHWRGIKSVLAQPRYKLLKEDRALSKIGLLSEGLKIIKTPKEFLSILKSIFNSFIQS